MKFYLQIVKGPKIPEPIKLKERNIIGRGSEADITIVEKGISRKHLLIEVKVDKIYLTDLGSSNGTTIGDERLKPNEPYEFTTFFMPIMVGSSVSIQIQTTPF